MHRLKVIIILIFLFTSRAFTQTTSSKDLIGNKSDLGSRVFRDTVRINIFQSDSLFLNKNLQLLAEKYNVEAVKAQIIQARLFDNPNISINQNAYNSDYKINQGSKWFDMSNKGETSIQVQQLFLLAGKRNKRINIAECNASKEEQNYYDLLRTLKYSLHSTYNNIFYTQKILKVFDREIESLSQTIKVFESQLDNGYSSKKEVLRLKSALFSLESEKSEYFSQLISDLSDFNVLLHSSDIYYIPDRDTIPSSGLNLNIGLSSAIDTAFTYRYDLKMARSDLDLSRMNLSYQKAMAIPDMTVIAGWDRNGGFIHNYNYLGLQFDLPFFNRNQGNIKTSRLNIESSKAKLQSAEDQVKSDVAQALSTMLEMHRISLKFNTKFLDDLELLNKEMIRNYENRNISLMEFLDFYDAFKENIIEYNTHQNNYLNAIENFNYSVGKELVKY